MKVYDPRIIKKETELIKKVQTGILTWNEAVDIMDKYIESLGYPQ